MLCASIGDESDAPQFVKGRVDALLLVRGEISDEAISCGDEHLEGSTRGHGGGGDVLVEEDEAEERP
jgi:hypothetical protein